VTATTDVRLGDGKMLKATAKGKVALTVKYGRKVRKCKLSDVLYIPDFSCNILSVFKAAQNGISMKFNESVCVIRGPNHEVITVAKKIDDLYELDVAPLEVYSTAHYNNRLSKEDLWHLQYGHLGIKKLQRIAQEHLEKGFDFSVAKEIQFCDSCLEGKQHRNPYPSCSNR
jgi:hypothetical protein